MAPDFEYTNVISSVAVFFFGQDNAFPISVFRLCYQKCLRYVGLQGGEEA